MFLGETGITRAGIMMSCFVHDLRNRLQVILENCEAFKNSGDIRYFNRAKKAVLGIMNSCEDFLALVRFRRLKLRYISLKSVLGELKTFLNPYLQKNNAKLHTSGDARLVAERSLIKSALLNLIINAVEAGARNVVVSVLENENSVILNVDDDGKKFDVKNEGLGLFSVKLVAKLHNGHLILGDDVKAKMLIPRRKENEKGPSVV